MTAPGAPALRLELWRDLAAAGGTRLDVVPDALGCVSRRTLDLSGTLTVTLPSTSRVVAQLERRRVLRLVRGLALGASERPDPAVADVEEWRIASVRQGAGREAGTVTVTAQSPLLDWAGYGPMRTTTAGGLPTWAGGGVLSAPEVLTQLVAWANARAGGSGAVWGVGTVADTAAQAITWTRATALAVLRQAQALWALEVALRRVGDATYLVDLVPRVGPAAGAPGGADAVPVVRAGGALTGLVHTRQTGELVTAVVPVGAARPDADGASWDVGLAAWRVAALPAAHQVTLVDPAGGPGPIQLAGQLVGTAVPTALQRPDGTRVAVTATAPGAGEPGMAAESVVTLAAAAGLAVGDLVQWRADLAGARLVALEAPAAIAALGRVEAPLERADLTGQLNHVPNPCGLETTGSGATLRPVGWTPRGGGPGPILSAPPALAAVSGAAFPAGCPIDGATRGWTVTFTDATQTLDFPLALAVDPVEGDADVSWYAVLWIGPPTPNGASALRKTFTTGGDTGSDPSVRLAVTAAPGSGPSALPADLPVARTWTSGQWVVLGLEGVRLATLARLQLSLVVDAGTIARATAGAWGAAGVYPVPVGDMRCGATPGAAGVAVTIAGVQIARAGTQPPFSRWPEATGLWQAGNRHLVAASRVGGVALEAAVLDLARLDPVRHADVPLVLGGSLDVRAPELAPWLPLPARVRIAALERDEFTPTASRLTLVMGDGTLGRSTATGAPGRPATLTDRLLASTTAPSAGASPAGPPPLAGWTGTTDVVGSARPVARIQSIAETETSETLQYVGTPAGAGTGPLEWRRQLVRAGAVGPWSAWAPCPAAPEVVPREATQPVGVGLEVRDVGPDGRGITAAASATVGPQLRGMDPATGRIRRAMGWDDGAYATQAQTSDGLTAAAAVRDASARLMTNYFQRNVDTLDVVADGGSYRRVAAGTVTGGVVHRTAVRDTRSVNDPPSAYAMGVTEEFKFASTLGIPNAGTEYGALSTVKPWIDNSGGKTTQTFKSSTGVVWKRTGFNAAGTWEPWRVLTETATQRVDRDSGHLDGTMQTSVGALASNLFRRGVDTLGDVGDGGGYARTLGSYLDAGRVATVYRAGAAEPALNLFKKAVDTFADVGGTLPVGRVVAATVSALAADLGLITAGKLQNAASTAGVSLGGAIPGTWTRYVDFAATGGAPFLKHEALSLNSDGSATFSGVVTAGSFTAPTARFGGAITLARGPAGGLRFEDRTGWSGSVQTEVASIRARTDLAATPLGTAWLCLSGSRGVQVGAAGEAVGFFGAIPGARPVVTGNRDGNPALSYLLDALQALGLIVNSTT